MTSQVHPVRAAAKEFCRNNLARCCAELRQWHRSGTLPAGRVTELAAMLEEVYGRQDSLLQARSEVEAQAVEFTRSGIDLPGRGGKADSNVSVNNNFYGYLCLVKKTANTKTDEDSWVEARFIALDLVKFEPIVQIGYDCPTPAVWDEVRSLPQDLIVAHYKAIAGALGGTNPDVGTVTPAIPTQRAGETWSDYFKPGRDNGAVDNEVGILSEVQRDMVRDLGIANWLDFEHVPAAALDRLLKVCERATAMHIRTMNVPSAWQEQALRAPKLIVDREERASRADGIKDVQLSPIAMLHEGLVSSQTELGRVHAFLLGEGTLDDMRMGDSDTARPRPHYWWRKHLRDAIKSTQILKDN